MSHCQYSILTLRNKKKSVSELLKPYLKKYFDEGRYRSEDLDYNKILPMPTNLSEKKLTKWIKKNYGSRHFVVNGGFTNNEYHFTSLNGIPWGIYKELSHLLNENILVEVNSNDDNLYTKIEFRPDRMFRCLYIYRMSEIEPYDLELQQYDSSEYQTELDVPQIKLDLTLIEKAELINQEPTQLKDSDGNSFDQVVNYKIKDFNSDNDVNKFEFEEVPF